jgi:[ribosomal protein S18]-alanine N-acetyltransferase
MIRPATLNDLAVLARLHRASFYAPWSEASFRELLDRPGSLALVGKNAAATDLQSFILIQVAADESEILSIATAPAARRSGLGRALIVEAASRAALSHANTMFLEVAEDNSAALALYRSCGFAAHGRRRAYYIRSGAEAVDALMLRVKLPLESAMGMMRGLD